MKKIEDPITKNEIVRYISLALHDMICSDLNQDDSEDQMALEDRIRKTLPETEFIRIGTKLSDLVYAIQRCSASYVTAEFPDSNYIHGLF